MDRAEIEKMFDETLATSPLANQVTPAQRERAIDELQKRFDRRESGIIDLQEQREIRMKLKSDALRGWK
jgi:hypothetical protein